MQRKYGKGGQLLDALRLPTELEMAFAAGFFEGEGCVYRIQKKVRGLAVAIHQKEPELLYRLRDFLGGSVRPRKNSKSSFSVGKTIWGLYLSGDRARDFLRKAIPYLSTRRIEQIEKAESGLVASISVETKRLAPALQDEVIVRPAWEHAELSRNDSTPLIN